MKVAIIQPYYSFDEKDTARCYDEMVALLDKCDDSLDLIVLPEYSDVPADQSSKVNFHNMIEKYNRDIMERSVAAARRCNAIVCVNAAEKTADGYRNTTHVLDRQGRCVGKYFKAHPAPSEVKTEAQGGNELDVGYSYDFAEPYVIELEGIRFGFMTCYDFYFYENFAPLARQNVDIIIGCSHQRTDTHEALSIINRFLCYNTNAYLIRSAVSLGEDSPICGCSCVIAPDGKVLVDMKSRIGMEIVDIDPHAKYYKAAGFKGALKSHYQYIEEGRRPWLYRNGGASVVKFDDVMPYPRVCAHRGFNAVAPENTLPAFGAAVALGAEEIEFDLRSTADGVLVCCNDATVDRVSNGYGRVCDLTYSELLSLDFGIKHSEKFKNLKIPTFEEILKKFAGRVVMNVHMKMWDTQKDLMLNEVIGLIRKYDCEKHVYLTSENDSALAQLKKFAPDIKFCVGWDGNRNPMSMVDRAIALGAHKIQLFNGQFTQETVDRAHQNGIICNMTLTNDPYEAKDFLTMGIDTVLTDDYLAIANALK